jgi:DNA invertase Pin-like site-specific DNA recombinase
VGGQINQHRAADDCGAGRPSTRAKARGQRIDRPPKLTPEQQREARRRRADGATLEELAQSYNVARATISRLGGLIINAVRNSSVRPILTGRTRE